MRLETCSILHEGASLTLYLHELLQDIDILARPMVLVIPGGGYEFVSEREAEPVAIEFYRLGYQAAVLRYSVNEKAVCYQPMAEAFEAVRLMRAHADDWNLLPDQIAVLGFSAGGHLAASTGVMWKEPVILKKLDIADPYSIRPDAMILCYAVLSSGPLAHRGSFLRLIGVSAGQEAAERREGIDVDRKYRDAMDAFDIPSRVDAETPETFLWHTQKDGAVPVENSLMMAQALQKYGVSWELHVYDEGDHGMSLCTREVATVNTHASEWAARCGEWLSHRFEPVYRD